MSEATEHEGVFGLVRKEDPNQLTAIRAREQACDDPELSNGAVRLFVRLLDMALNPFINNGRRGQVIVSQMKLAYLFSCTMRSIRRWTWELVRVNYIWTSLVPRQNTKPILCYHVTVFQPKRQVAQDMPGDGLWGNGKRRFDSGFIRSGNGATGRGRRMGSVLLDRFGNPIFLDLSENALVRGHAEPVQADKIVRSQRTPESSASGQNCPVTEDNDDLSHRSELSGDNGQNCPVREDAGVRHKESPVGDSALPKGKGTPQKSALEEWITGLAKKWPRELEDIKTKLIEQRKKCTTVDARVFIGRKIRAVDEALLGPTPEETPAPAPKRPARSAPTSAPATTDEELLAGAEFAVASGKGHLLNQRQRELLANRK